MKTRGSQFNSATPPRRQTGSALVQNAPSVSTPSVLRRLCWSIIARRYEVLGLGLYTFVLVIRAPWILFQGRLWAEEGTFFLQYAWTHSFLDALIAPHAGYYNLVSNLAGIIGAHVPLEIAPRLTTLLALFIQIIPASLVLFTARSRAGYPPAQSRRALALARCSRQSRGVSHHHQCALRALRCHRPRVGLGSRKPR